MTSGNRPRRRLSPRSILVGFLLIAYWFAQPALNKRFEWNLPEFPFNPSSQEKSSFGSERSTTPILPDTQPHPQDDALEDESPFVVGESVPASQQSRRGASTFESEKLLHGILLEIQPGRYLSPAGLIYGPGSEQGHRLKHLTRHLQDQVARPGAHGVFDGKMEDVLKVIDEGYSSTRSSRSSVQRQDSGNRTVYSIPIGRRIGYVGGLEGKKRGNPPAHRLRLVLEGRQVITAFPL